jgi:WD40 repeat protein
MTSTNSPFKFLDSYTKNDREIFFGREREIEELYHRVFESKIMLVYGVSGTGKSSLIHCGLANKFQETDWLPIVIRRGGNIIESLAAGILSASITAQQTKLVSPVDFKKSVKSLYLDHYKPVFFIFDQFEELFIFGDKEERRAFIHIVKTLTESDLQCRMIFVMREEYMAGVTEFEKFIPTFFANRVRIEKMSQRNALEAIKGPCKVFNISIEEGFAETLLEKLSPGETDVELTYLQVFLDKIFRLTTGFLPPPGEEPKGGSLVVPESKAVPSFTLPLLNKVGNVSDLLGSFLDEQISKLDNPQEGLIILKSFVSIKGTKRQVSPEEISDYSSSLGKQVDETSVHKMLQTFIQLRILRDKDQDGKYELRHDALAAKIYEKISLVEKETLEIRSFIENAYENFKKRNVLLDSKDLEYISKYEKSLFLKPDLNEFVRKSKERSLANLRTFRIITSIVAVVFLLIICGAGYYYFRSSSTVTAKNLALESIFIKKEYPSAAWRLATESYKLKKIPITTRAVFESFYNFLEKKIYIDSLGNQLIPQKGIFDEFSSDGEYIFGYLSDNTIKIWDKKGLEIRTFSGIKAPILSVKLSDDNKLIAGLDMDSTIYIWSSEGNPVLKSKAYYNLINPDNVLGFSPDGKFIACLISGNKTNIFRSSGELLQTLEGHNAPVVGVSFSPDSRFIATASMDSTVTIWYYNNNKSAYDIYNILKGHKNIVWSAHFSKNSKYVLSGSADSTYKIWNLNGTIVFNHTYGFLNPAIGGKFCEVTFNAGDDVISSTHYILSDQPIDSGEKKIIYKKRPRIYDMEASYPGAYNLYWKYANRLIFSDSISHISLISFGFNNSLEYTAYSLSNNDATYFCGTKDAFRIYSFNGILQQFSPDGKRLLTVDGKSLRLYPVDENEMFRLIDSLKIIGELEPKQQLFTEWYSPH